MPADGRKKANMNLGILGWWDYETLPFLLLYVLFNALRDNLLNTERKIEHSSNSFIFRNLLSFHKDPGNSCLYSTALGLLKRWGL